MVELSRQRDRGEPILAIGGYTLASLSLSKCFLMMQRNINSGNTLQSPLLSLTQLPRLA
jgi:hypothetical protein